MLYIAHVIIIIFRAESNQRIFRTQRHHLHGAGGQVEQGQGGVQHVGGGVVQTIRYTCIRPIFSSKIQWKYPWTSLNALSLCIMHNA